ncbi:B3 domain-containing transcription factor VRN1-like [Gastrolobium bilobum]|uniref:B3 domain-containing transcription factor VRN1-like n=1 Tax=Gastrolobium bilobum TaxID=150636 RepID=UPI002AAFBABA|nr:B3 domain-containing transcription factor VRN1-like [Gastrolobium bilobum]
MTYNCNRQNKHPIHTPILFFKIILRTSLQDGKLKLPNNFTKKYGGDMPNPMFLKPEDGTEWELFWTKNDGDIWLQKGWKEFSTYYSLDHGHMVLFEYKHTSHFDVRIFDKSTLEINYPFHCTQDERDNLDQISDDHSVKISDELPPCHKNTQKSPMSSPQPCKKLRTCTSNVERSSTLQIEGTILEKSKFASVKKEPDEDIGGTTEFLRVKQFTSKITEAIKKAKTFRSESPSFTVVMKPAYVDGYNLNVPLVFMRDYFNNMMQIVMLQFGKKLWPVNLVSYASANRNGARWKFSNGWLQFARESKFVDGDDCVFELINRENAVLNVHIF